MVKETAPRIDAVALDLGGVLVRVDFHPCLSALGRLCRLSSAEVERRIFASGLKEDHDIGATTSEEFIMQVRNALACPVSSRRFRQIWCAIFTPYPSTAGLVAAVRRAGVRLVLFSNTDPLHVECIGRRWSFLAGFDAFAVSYRLRALKPDPRFFMRARRAVDVNPARTIFLDDRAENVAAAQACGFVAVRARGAAQALAILRRRGLLARVRPVAAPSRTQVVGREIFR
jgi:FMN phosphatase YigB (HAD superfamily)